MNSDKSDPSADESKDTAVNTTNDSNAMAEIPIYELVEILISKDPDNDCSKDYAFDGESFRKSIEMNNLDNSNVLENEQKLIDTLQECGLNNDEAKAIYLSIVSNLFANTIRIDQDEDYDTDHEQKFPSLDSDEDESNHDQDEYNDDEDESNDDKSDVQYSDVLYTVIVGTEQKRFSVKSLQNMQYFKNYFSKRWSINGSIKILVNDDIFTMQELELIVNCKQSDIFPDAYPYERLPYLINALDYFVEIIDNEKIFKYLLNCTPMVKLKDINKLKDTNKIVKSSKLKENKPFFHLNIAINKYTEKFKEIQGTTKNRFVEKWETLPIDIIAKMPNVSFQILMNTLKLIKLDEPNSNLRDSKYPWYDRDCVIGIKFLEKRSLDDFNKLFRTILVSSYDHICEIISSLITSFSERDKLSYWIGTSKAGIKYVNKYKNIEYSKKWNIASIVCQMISIVLKKYVDCFDKCDAMGVIIAKYATVFESNDFNALYDSIIDIYFSRYKSLEASIALLFNDLYFDEKMLNNKFQELDENVKLKFLNTIWSTYQSYEINNKTKIMNFFMKNNKNEAFGFIENNILKDFVVEFISIFKPLLKSGSDELTKLYSITIDKYFDELNENKNIHNMITCFDDKEIIQRFSIKNKKQKINFINNSFKVNMSPNNLMYQKQKKICAGLLKCNLPLAKETMDSWFPLLITDEKEWIIKEFLNGPNLSLMFLEKMLNKITDLLIGDKDLTIPQEYFDFVDKQAN